jgi:excinuclease ABC subunit B
VNKTPKQNLFKLNSAYKPTGDQPAAIKQLLEGLNSGTKEQVLLGVTGSGKTFTMANLIQETGKPTLIISHNKTLAAQLYAEFRSYFPHNAVHYFVSYFDYYQPEAYIASSDTFIEKDSKINEEIDRLRHAATSSLLSRRDVIIIASVSCIYGIGSVEDYGAMAIKLSVGEKRKYDKFLRHLTDIQYERNDYAMERGTFRAKGDVVDVIPAGEEIAYRIEFFGDEIETLKVINPLTGEVIDSPQELTIYPSSHYVTPREKLNGALGKIEQELELQTAKFKKNQQFIEHQRIKQRVDHDLEMMRETGFVKGIENYSRYLTNRAPGEQPATLLDYFPDDFLMIVDESHMTLPQIRGMYNGDRARKEVLVEHGFRLPSALDNRPLTFAEFENHVNQAIYVSATPGPYELEKDPNPAQQIIRPTGLLDPEIEIRPTANQVDDLIDVIRKTIESGHRVLATTLTKRMAEDLSEHLEDLGIKAAYLHSDVDTVERTDILRDLRLGIYDVLIGINLLREGLDLPEVSLVAILDADKEGFLRSESALVQTIGRAARHQDGKVIMYADSITGSMERAISETKRRRALQIKFNKENGITPTTITKEISQGLREIISSPDKKKLTKKELQEQIRQNALDPLSLVKGTKGKIDEAEKRILIKDLQSQMILASESLQFELAAQLRDAIKTLQE